MKNPSQPASELFGIPGFQTQRVMKSDFSFIKAMLVVIALLLAGLIALQLRSTRRSATDHAAVAATEESVPETKVATNRPGSFQAPDPFRKSPPRTNGNATRKPVAAILPPADGGSDSVVATIPVAPTSGAAIPTMADGATNSTVSGIISPASTGISGKITLKGTPPPPAVAEATCGEAGKLKIKSRQYVVGENGGLANVLVYLKSGTAIDGKTFAPPADKPLLDQVNCEYHPYVLPVMAGQTFIVRNSDSVLHNINSTRAKINKGKNFGQPTKGHVSEMVFDKKEVAILFKCDIHPWMTTYVAVLDNPWFAVTDEDGNYSIPNVPAGNYEVMIYHPKTHGATEGLVLNVIVKDGEFLPLNTTIIVPELTAK
jgi:hypothetical protein